MCIQAVTSIVAAADCEPVDARRISRDLRAEGLRSLHRVLLSLLLGLRARACSSSSRGLRAPRRDCVAMFSHHSHSGQFCAHAKGSLEAVVLEAIRQGFTLYALTEHMPRYRTELLYPEEVRITPTQRADAADRGRHDRRRPDAHVRRLPH